MDLSKKSLESLPTNLPKAVGFFDCSFNFLTTLNGSPKEVNDYYLCYYNRLTDLIGSPSYVGNIFDCSNNKLTNLIGSPNHVGDYFNSNDNQLESLLGAPEIIKDNLNIGRNPNLLDISDIWDSDIGGSINFDLNSRMAILPLIKFRYIHGQPIIDKIHKRNRGSSKQNIIDFQYDLCENGFEDNAKWKP